MKLIYILVCFSFSFSLSQEKFNEYSKTIIQMLKSIGHEISPELKAIFVNFFNEFINNFYVRLTIQNSNNFRIKHSLINILQRLIIILGADCFQFLFIFFKSALLAFLHTKLSRQLIFKVITTLNFFAYFFWN